MTLVELLIISQKLIGCKNVCRLGLSNIHNREPRLTENGDSYPQEDEVVHLRREKEILLNSVGQRIPKDGGSMHTL